MSKISTIFELEPIIGDSYLSSIIAGYARTCKNRLNAKEQHDLQEYVSEYSLACCRKDFDQIDNPSILYSNVENMMKTFLFTQCETIPLTHNHLQQKAFTTLQGRELELYYKRFLQRWTEEEHITLFSGTQQYQSYPATIYYLSLNQNVTIDYFLPFIKQPSADKISKDLIIKYVAKLVQDTQKTYLTKQQIEYLLTTYNTEGVDLTPIASSIRYHANLADYPDAWVEEMYSLNAEATTKDRMKLNW